MSNTRAMLIYDWKWLESHAPFKRIFEKTCELEIEREAQRIPTIAGCHAIKNHYKIKYNHFTFEHDFERIKAMLLNTNICKHNRDVYDYGNSMEGTKDCACRLIIDGCIVNCSGSFEWNNISNS